MLDQLQEALDGLTPLVDGVARGSYSEEDLRDEMLAWESDHAGGNAGLAELAISTLRFRLAGEGMRGSIEENAEREQALRRLEAALFPPAEAGLVEVEAAPEFAERFPDARMYHMGEVQVIAEEEEGGWHVSVSHRERLPTVEELRTAATLAGGADVMWVPLSVPGGAEPLPSTVVHLFETPPG